MVYTCLCLYYFYSFLLAEFSQYFSYILLQLTVYFFPPILRCKYYMILTSTFWMCRTFYFICTFLSHCQKPPWYFLVMRSPNHLLFYHAGFIYLSILSSSVRTGGLFPRLKAPTKAAVLRLGKTAAGFYLQQFLFCVKCSAQRSRSVLEWSSMSLCIMVSWINAGRVWKYCCISSSNSEFLGICSPPA